MFISAICVNWCKNGLTGSWLGSWEEEKGEEHGGFICPFTYVYEISEIFTLAGVFLLGEEEDNSKKAAYSRSGTFVLKYIYS